MVELIELVLDRPTLLATIASKSLILALVVESDRATYNMIIELSVLFDVEI